MNAPNRIPDQKMSLFHVASWDWRVKNLSLPEHSGARSAQAALAQDCSHICYHRPVCEALHTRVWNFARACARLSPRSKILLGHVGLGLCLVSMEGCAGFQAGPSLSVKSKRTTASLYCNCVAYLDKPTSVLHQVPVLVA